MLEHGGYGGEAIVTFSPPGASFVVPYAVELGVRIAEERDHRTVVQSLRVQDRYLVVTEEIIATTTYRVTSSLPTDVVVTIEHPQRTGWSLLDTVAPRETGEGAARWDVAAPAADQANLGALGTSGDEGSLRQRYVAIISESEDRLATLQSSDDSLAAEYATVESDINTKLDALSSGTAD